MQIKRTSVSASDDHFAARCTTIRFNRAPHAEIASAPIAHFPWPPLQGIEIARQKKAGCVKRSKVRPLPSPHLRISLGITGHRSEHPGFAPNHARIAAVLAGIFDRIDAQAKAVTPAFGPGNIAPSRLHCLLADGTDQLASELALQRGYELIALLPFGPALNRAINSMPGSAADARTLLGGAMPSDPAASAHANVIDAMSKRVSMVALADSDARLTARLIAHLESPEDAEAARLYAVETSRQVAVAGGMLIEQSDLLIAVWDGVTTAHPGGTGHTVAVAVERGSPVLWIDPASPEDWRILMAPESLAQRRLGSASEAAAQLDQLVRKMLGVDDDVGERANALDHEQWRPRSVRMAHGYRRIEALFGGGRLRDRLRRLTEHYEHPETVGEGSGAEALAHLRQLPGADQAFAARIESEVMRRFAWVDGISARLSDAYRGGMTVNFLLSSFAIVGGLAYLPLGSSGSKWIFTLFELALLGGILLITSVGLRKRWHGRWFETRRVAEYLRHSPLMLALGAARSAGRWPQGAETSWPEFYARQTIRSVGLPQISITNAYLRGVLSGLLKPHVTSQRDYHSAKAERLTTVHHRLDHMSERLFQFAVATVTSYLLLKLGVAVNRIDGDWLEHASKWFTLLGVAFPTFGASIAGIRYFGDFERFAAISQITAAKLDSVAARITILEAASDAELTYRRVAALAHATDDIVFAEIENWQAVFGGKQISVPV